MSYDLAATDDSAWQGTAVDYAAVKAAGISAVWHRCGYGNDRHPQAGRLGMGKDGTYDRNVAKCRAAGLLQGLYFFPLPHTEPAAASYDAVMRYTGGDPLDLWAMVDFEDAPGVNTAAAMGGSGPLTEWCLDLGGRLLAAWGPSIAYTGGFSNYRLLGDARLLTAYPVNWTPNYGSTTDYNTQHQPTFRPSWPIRATAPWAQADIIQHSGGNGRCPGYPGAVDLDALSSPTLARVTRTGATPHPGPTPAAPAQEATMERTIIAIDTKHAQFVIDPGPGTARLIDGDEAEALTELGWPTKSFAAGGAMHRKLDNGYTRIGYDPGFG